MTSVADQLLTTREIDVLIAYARTGDQRAAAAAMEMSYQTFKNHATHAYAKLGVQTALEAFRELGWLALPSQRDVIALRARQRAAAITTRLRAIRDEVDEYLALMRAPGSDAGRPEVGDPAGPSLPVAGESVAATPASSLRRVS